MPITRSRPRPRLRRPLMCLAIAGILLLETAAPVGAASGDSLPGAESDSAAPGERGWVWPAERFRVARAFVAPEHRYGPGHRGVDLDLLGGVTVRTPAPGVVAFSGAVAGRGIVTVDHGDGLVTTLEPVQTALPPGQPVVRGEAVGQLSLGGHAAPGTLHFGVRRDGEYINPMLLLGGVPRAVLLPCCE